MKWQKAPAEMVQIFDTAMKALPEAEKRKMFGYPAAFTNGYMFAGLHQESLVLKPAAPDYKAFLKIAGSKPFEPMPGRTMSGFVVVPTAMLQSPLELKVWLKKALTNARSLLPKVPKAKTPRAK